MTDKTLLNIIKQKGVGRYLGICEGNLDAIENYSEYIQMSEEILKDLRKEFNVVYDKGGSIGRNAENI